jgi:excisionase family DNA binding protein
MRTADRLEVLLSGVSAEDRIRLRPVQWAAEFLALSVPTIYRHVARESIPYVKLGGRVLFRLADLVAWSQEREVAAPVSQSPRSTARARFDVAEPVDGGGGA